MDINTFLILLLLVKVNLVAPLEAASRQLYQPKPALIGFRCENSQEVTEEGISIIEANRPVQLTIFGNYFTPNTIVAFTTEFVPAPDAVDRTKLANELPKTISQNISSSSVVDATSSPHYPHHHLATTSEKQQSPLAVNEKFKRRKKTSQSYDCTDFNRITSYKLTSENILSPNVAFITINLPELDESVSGSRYYYFCLKQQRHEQQLIPNDNNGLLDSTTANNHRPEFDGQTATTTTGNKSSSEFGNGGLVWVHQGNDWWLTIKVEPPILSVANDCVLILLLLFLSAVTSGLNLGLMSLDMNELAVISSCGDQRERSYARAIVPVRKRGNYLLCSLLLGNVMVNSTLTVILEEMTSGLVAVIGSTLAIVILGEIVPQAFCSRQGLAIGAKTIWLTYAFMLLTFPLSYPISCLLDWVLGEEKGNVYDRERLMEFIKITGHHTQLEADEVAIISGALKLKKIKVDQIMTRIEDVFMLPLECMLNRDTIRRIIEKGYSRIPVYELGDRKQIVALILAKDLALLDPDDQVPVADMLKHCIHPLIFIEYTATLDLALNEFKTGKSHMAVVRQLYDDGEVDKYYEAIGIVTLEDVIEEVLQTEINDETDTLSDNRRKRRRTDAQVAHFLDIEPAAAYGGGGGGGVAGGRPATSSTGLPTTTQALDSFYLHQQPANFASNNKCAPPQLQQQLQQQQPASGHHQEQRQQYIVAPPVVVTCRRIVVSLLVTFADRLRSALGQVRYRFGRLFVSCLGGGGGGGGGRHATGATTNLHGARAAAEAANERLFASSSSTNLNRNSSSRRRPANPTTAATTTSSAAAAATAAAASQPRARIVT